MRQINLIRNAWNWHGQEVQYETFRLITLLMDDGDYYMFAGFAQNGARLWTLDKSKAVIFADDREAWNFVEKYIPKKERNRLLIRFGSIK
ncbi:MAG: hypothetical protein QXL17_02820 [Candidatus Thermoplasmatota archaeon]